MTELSLSICIGFCVPADAKILNKCPGLCLAIFVRQSGKIVFQVFMIVIYFCKNKKKKNVECNSYNHQIMAKMRVLIKSSNKIHTSAILKCRLLNNGVELFEV